MRAGKRSRGSSERTKYEQCSDAGQDFLHEMLPSSRLYAGTKGAAKFSVVAPRSYLATPANDPMGECRDNGDAICKRRAREFTWRSGRTEATTALTEGAGGAERGAFSVPQAKNQ
jgi:hypothetical protein